MKSIFLLPILVLLFTGCAVVQQPLQLEPVKKANAIAPKFAKSYYFFDRDHNVYFVMRADSTDAATGKPVAQIATIRVFWRPRGGLTTLNATALNATFRYILMSPDAIGMYEGAGFVLLDSADGALKFNARVMDGDMRLTQASANFTDTLGRAHLRGHFTALFDDATALDMLMDAHREFFARSLNSKPAAAIPSPEDWGISSPLPTISPTPAAPPISGPSTSPAIP